MTTVLMLIAAYGICFGLMNDKAEFLTDALRKLPLFKNEEGHTFFQRLLRCPYCTGFHAGWLVWLIANAKTLASCKGDWVTLLGEVLIFSFASSASCYLIDTAAQKLEG